MKIIKFTRYTFYVFGYTEKRKECIAIVLRYVLKVKFSDVIVKEGPVITTVQIKIPSNIKHHKLVKHDYS